MKTINIKKSHLIHQLFKINGNKGVNHEDAIAFANDWRLAAWKERKERQGYKFHTEYEEPSGKATYWIIEEPTKRKSAKFLKRESANSEVFKQDKQA